MLSKFKFADRTTTELCQHFKCTESYCNQCKKVHKYAQAVGRLNIFLKARVAWHVMSAHLHKKTGILRAGEAGERARAEGGIGSVLSAPIFALLRLVAASFSVRRVGVEAKEKPLSAGC